jgi:hypothetical protein
LFVLVILGHERRRIVHVAVTDHPTRRGRRNSSAAFPGRRRPAIWFLIGISAFHAWTTTAAALGIESPHRAAVAVAERVQTTDRIPAPRMPRHRHPQCGGLRRVLNAVDYT